jgi:hypothetical protein
MTNFQNAEKKKKSRLFNNLGTLVLFPSFNPFLSKKKRSLCGREEMGLNSGILGRNFYHHLPESRRRRGFPARMWVSLKRVAARSVAFYVGKRRPRRMERRVVWISLYLKRRVAKVARASRTRHVLKSYDEHSYSQNFDDGRWQREDEEFYRSRSFAIRFVGLPMSNLGFSGSVYSNNDIE